MARRNGTENLPMTRPTNMRMPVPQEQDDLREALSSRTSEADKHRHYGKCTCGEIWLFVSAQTDGIQ